MQDQHPHPKLSTERPEEAYEVFMRLVDAAEPGSKAAFEKSLRAGFPMHRIERIVRSCGFPPELEEIFLAAIRWKRNMLIVTDMSDVHFGGDIANRDC